MADARDSNGGFVGSSTVQVLDSSPRGPATETVEAILVPESTVSFPQEAAVDDDGVTVRDLQLVGDDLVLMEGGVIVGEESGTILVQDSLYVQSDQHVDENSEHVIAYLPESVPDQGHSLASDDTENKADSQLFETVGEGEDAMYDSASSTVPTMDEPGESAEIVDDVALPPQGPSALYVTSDHEVSVETELRDQALAQEVPQQTDEMIAAEDTSGGPAIAVPELVDNDTVPPARLLQEESEQMPDENQSVVEITENESSNVPEEVQALVSDGEQAEEVERQARSAIYETTGETSRGPDQELQVVPDSSACTETSKVSVSENLHEAMEVTEEEVEGSSGIQMVPTSAENSRDTTLAAPEEAMLPDSNLGLISDDRGQSELEERGDPGAASNDEVPDGSDCVITEAEVVDLQPTLDDGTVLQVDERTEQQVAYDGDAGQTASGVTLQSVDISQLFAADSAPKNVMRVLQNVDPAVPQSYVTKPSAVDGEQSYELCVAMPGGQNIAAGKTITVPVTIGNQVQQIPIQLPDWADLTQQSLVAVAEDGTTIPLTLIQTTDEVTAAEHQETADQLRHDRTGQILEQLPGTVLSEGKLLLTDETGSGGQDGIAFINMLQSQDSVLLGGGAEFQEGIIHLVQNADGTQTAISGFQVHPASSTTQTNLPQYIYSDSGLSVQEQSILPDNPEELAARVIHIPEDAYLSGQPIELQVVEVADNRTVRPILARSTVTRGAARSRGRRGTPSAVTVQPRPPRQLANRMPRGQGKVTASESQRAIRSIGRGQTAVRKSTARSSTASELDHVIMTTDTPMVHHEVKTTTVEQQDELPPATEHAPQVELSNTTPSVISPENMQTLIQILQTLPNTSRGQTIQIILQNNPPAATGPDTLVQSAVSSSVGPDGTPKQQYVQVVRMPPTTTKVTKTTSDIAIQVSPEFIETAQAEVVASSPVILPSGSETPASTVVIADPSIDSNQEMVEVATAETGDEDDPQLTAAILMGLGIECGDAPTRKRRQSRKKSSKQIVTVEEQWVVDPKPGVSYYAVIDYLSEHDQEGFSSASEMKRPEAPSSGFMEDHLELHGAPDDAKGRSMLESTIDSSVIISPFRRGKYRASTAAQTGPTDSSIDLPPSADQSSVTLQERTFEEAKLEEEAQAEQALPEMKRPKRTRTPRAQSERYDHRCGYCEFGSRDKILVVEHCISEHAEQPVKTLSLLPQMGGRTCPYCHQSFDHSEFFSHMRFAHNEVHPYKCGYCDFMGRDRNQIRHHIQKKHRLPMKVINLMDTSRRHEDSDPHGRKRIMALSEGEETVYEYLTDEEEMEDNDSDNTSSRRGLICPECKKTFKTLKYLKTHIKIHQAHRYQCGYCDFISVMLHQVIRHCQRKHAELDPKVLTKELEPDKNPIVSRDIDTVVKKVFSLNTRLPRDPDASKWMRKWFCPHCDYTCQFGASYRRHLRMHANVLPFKCNYCSFKGREKYYVRRHIHRMHRDLPMIVVENTPENCAGDTSSDEDFQEKGLRRKRRRRTKDSIHAVVPVGGMEDEDFGQQFQKLPVGERGMRGKKFAGADLENDPSVAKAVPLDDEGRKSKTVPRLPRTKEWSGENISDYIQEKDGDKIVCKMCGQKTLAKAFYKHARKHFKIKPFKCGYCNYMSIERAKIRVHNTLKHPNAPFKIEECHLASITPQDFMDLIGVEGPNQEEGRADAPPAVTIQFCCPLCQSTIDYDEKNLRDHFFAHYDYYPFKCSECDFRATSEYKVLEHSAVHDTPIIVYEIQLEKPEGLEETVLQFLKEGHELIEQQRLEGVELQSAPEASAVHGDEGRAAEDGGAASMEKSTSSIFQCPLCDRQMNLHAVTVRRHLYSHYNYKPFKCGYCNFQGVSKANIKQHTVTHGSVRPKIEITDELMPDDLTKMLRHIQGVLKLTPETVDNPVVVDESLLGGNWEDPLTMEGKLWKDMLARGQCPWCSANVGTVQAKLHGHLLAHFSPRPFQCGHCPERFVKRSEVNQHIIRTHKGLELKVVEVIEDESTVRKGLLQYLKHKRSSVGARSLVENTTVDPTAAIVAAAKSIVEPQSAIQEAVDSEDGKEYQYQVVILDEDGTVVESMEVVAERATAAMDETSEVIGKARTAEEKDVGDKADQAENEPLVIEMADDTAASASEEVQPSLDAAPVEQESMPIAETEPGSEVRLPQDENQPKGDDDEDTLDADIVTVEGVLLTRSFRSETEASDDGSALSSQSSSSSDDDDDEVLACGPSLEFVSDILGLLKRSAVTTAQQKAAAKLQANLECELCHRRFLKPSGLQTHMTRVHKSMPKMHCAYCYCVVKDRAALLKHSKEAHPDQPVLVQEDQQPSEGERQAKRAAESAVDVDVASKRVKLDESEKVECGPPDLEVTTVAAQDHCDNEEEETVENITKMLQREGNEAEQNLVLVQEVFLEGAALETVTKEIAVMPAEVVSTPCTGPETTVHIPLRTGLESIPHQVATEDAALGNVPSVPVEASVASPVTIQTDVPVPVVDLSSTTVAKTATEETALASEGSSSPPPTAREESLDVPVPSEEMTTKDDIPVGPPPSTATGLQESESQVEVSPVPAKKKELARPKTPAKADTPTKSGKATRHSKSSTPQRPVRIGKYQLRGRGRHKETVSASKQKPQRVGALPEVSVETEPDTSLNTPETSRTEPNSTRASQSEDPISAEDASDAVLEGLENLEECDENLPKILQILQLRPRKETDKI